jgi:hypothetical protein
LTVILFELGRRPVGLALTFQEPLAILERVLFVVAVAWLVFRLIDLAVLALQIRAERRGNQGVIPVLVPGARLIKLSIVLIGVLGVLGTLGVNNQRRRGGARRRWYRGGAGGAKDSREPDRRNQSLRGPASVGR